MPPGGILESGTSLVLSRLIILSLSLSLLLDINKVWITNVTNVLLVFTPCQAMRYVFVDRCCLFVTYLRLSLSIGIYLRPLDTMILPRKRN